MHFLFNFCLSNIYVLQGSKITRSFFRLYLHIEMTNLSFVIFFWYFGINNSITFSIENWIPLKPILHFTSLSLIYRLNKTETAIAIFLFWFGCSRGIDILPEFLSWTTIPQTSNTQKFAKVSVRYNVLKLP